MARANRAEATTPIAAPTRREHHALGQHQPQDRAAFGAQRHPHADLRGALVGDERHRAVESDHGEQRAPAPANALSSTRGEAGGGQVRARPDRPSCGRCRPRAGRRDRGRPRAARHAARPRRRRPAPPAPCRVAPSRCAPGSWACAMYISARGGSTTALWRTWPDHADDGQPRLVVGAHHEALADRLLARASSATAMVSLITATGSASSRSPAVEAAPADDAQRPSPGSSRASPPGSRRWGSRPATYGRPSRRIDQSPMVRLSGSTRTAPAARHARQLGQLVGDAAVEADDVGRRRVGRGRQLHLGGEHALGAKTEVHRLQ